MERAVPILPADDLGVAKRFYTALGFSVTFEATSDARPASWDSSEARSR
jgi:predicted lactoylglutathione lyase